MKFAWRNNIPDLVAWNSEQTEEVDLDEFQELLATDMWADEVEKGVDEFVLED
jgi:hypothetical protein